MRAPAPGSSRNVVYSLSGTAAAPDVHYSNDAGDQHVSDVSLPNYYTALLGPDTTPMVSAAIGAAGGTVACTITIDGTHVTTQSGAGPGTTVTCTG